MLPQDNLVLTLERAYSLLANLLTKDLYLKAYLNITPALWSQSHFCNLEPIGCNGNGSAPVA